MKNVHRLNAAIVGCLLFSAGANAQDWPQWRGPNRDNAVKGFDAPTAWPKALTQKWQVSVGVGEASPVLVGDKIYVFGRQEGDEITRCLDAASGRELWQDKYPAATIKGAAGGYAGPRSTPAVADGKVCTLGVHGVVSCLDAASGKLLWRKETGAPPKFFTSSSPLIADGKCIVFAAALTAYDLAMGEAKWQWNAGTPYGSPALMTVAGTKLVVTPASGVLAGIALQDGKPLWQVKIGTGGFDYQSNFSTPMIAGDMVFYSAAVKGKFGGGGGGAGNILALKIERNEEGFAARELWKKSPAAHQYHTPLLKDGLIFGVSAPARNFFCLNARTGEQQWTDPTQRGQCGCILDTGKNLMALTSDRELIVLKPSSKEYDEVAKYRVSEAETWCVPIIAGNRIFVKDKAGNLTLWTVN